MFVFSIIPSSPCDHLLGKVWPLGSRVCDISFFFAFSYGPRRNKVSKGARIRNQENLFSGFPTKRDLNQSPKLRRLATEKIEILLVAS